MQIDMPNVQMKSRRSLLGFLTALFVEMRAKAQARGGAKELARHEVPGGMEVVLVDVTAVPGGASAAHRHPGFVMGYVLDGEMKFAINGESAQVIKTGGTFFEPAGTLHTASASNKPDAPVRFLAFMVVPKGSATVLPA